MPEPLGPSTTQRSSRCRGPVRGRAARPCPARPGATPDELERGQAADTAGSCPPRRRAATDRSAVRSTGGDVDAVVIGAGPERARRRQPARRRRLAGARARSATRARRRRPQRRADAPRLRARHLQRVLPARRVVSGHARARPRVVRAAVAPFAARARAPHRRRTVRGLVDRRRRDRRIARGVRAGRRRRVALAHDELRAGQRADPRRDDVTVPAGDADPSGSPATLGPRGLLEFTRLSLLSVRRLTQERFRGEGAALLLAGNAMHSDLGPDVPPSGFLGWLLTGSRAAVRLPRARGWRRAADRRAGATPDRAGRRGAVQRTGGRAWRSAIGAPWPWSWPTARRSPRPEACSPTSARPRSTAISSAKSTSRRGWSTDLDRFQYDPATFKVDWALSGPIPWRTEAATRAGTVHVSDSMDRVTAGTRPTSRRTASPPTRSCSSAR